MSRENFLSSNLNGIFDRFEGWQYLTNSCLLSERIYYHRLTSVMLFLPLRNNTLNKLCFAI